VGPVDQKGTYSEKKGRRKKGGKKRHTFIDRTLMRRGERAKQGYQKGERYDRKKKTKQGREGFHYREGDWLAL